MSNNLPKLLRDKRLMKILATIDDPELHIPITDMGLIYGAKMTRKKVADITITLTTVGCPLFDVIKGDIEKALLEKKDIESVNINLTFDPPWHPGMMSEEYQLEMGIL